MVNKEVLIVLPFTIKGPVGVLKTDDVNVLMTKPTPENVQFV